MMVQLGLLLARNNHLASPETDNEAKTNERVCCSGASLGKIYLAGESWLPAATRLTSSFLNMIPSHPLNTLMHNSTSIL